MSVEELDVLMTQMKEKERRLVFLLKRPAPKTRRPEIRARYKENKEKIKKELVSLRMVLVDILATYMNNKMGNQLTPE